MLLKGLQLQLSVSGLALLTYHMQISNTPGSALAPKGLKSQIRKREAMRQPFAVTITYICQFISCM